MAQREGQTVGAVIGYARTSTSDQIAGLEAQIRDLTAAGCTKLFQEQISSVAVERPELKRAIEYLREGDTFIVTRLDRLARSAADLLRLTEELGKKGVALRFLANPELDTRSANGKLILTVLGAIAQFERDLLLERQKEGISRAKAEKKYRGRKPTARAKSAEVLDLHKVGVGPVEISRRLGIGRSSIYRIIRAKEAAG
jgi:DNA invertase Pin-like site-specific DNA recombinase